LSFAWLVEDQSGFAAASHNADAALKAVVESARGRRATLADTAGLTDSVRRVGEQAALYSYLDARVVFGSTGPASPAPAPVLLAVGKRGTSAWVRLEIAKPAVDLAAAGLLGK